MISCVPNYILILYLPFAHNPTELSRREADDEKGPVRMGNLGEHRSLKFFIKIYNSTNTDYFECWSRICHLFLITERFGDAQSTGDANETYGQIHMGTEIIMSFMIRYHEMDVRFVINSQNTLPFHSHFSFAGDSRWAAHITIDCSHQLLWISWNGDNE